MSATRIQTTTTSVDGLKIRYADSGTAGPVILMTSPWPESLVVGSGGASYPLEVTGTLADIIAAPSIDAFAGQDIRATIGATVEPAAPRAREPEVWEDYVSAYENGRFPESTRYVRAYPDELPVLRDLLPAVGIPVHVFAAAYDPLVPVSNGQYLAERIPGSLLSILPASHFAWEEIPHQFAGIITDLVTRAEATVGTVG